MSADTFVVESFVAECTAARARADWPEAVAAILRRVIARPDAIARAMARRGVSARRGFDVFVQSPTLTIYQIDGPAGLLGPPHDHATVAVVGIYAGSEGYRVYRREGARVLESGHIEAQAPDVAILPVDLVHAIDNTATRGAASLHVYGNGHFDAEGRHLWDPWTFEEVAFSSAQQFAWTRELTRARGRGG